ncbi:DUF4870 domain-containing protein [Paenibacillus agaridevorans]|uniref:DUF4870 domain-containing protein n=1 Tax=Paenibacillus agaridevorans TaxID=171404 RepID=UPI000D58E4D5|nr:hypothetical protein [Paenibacillus agaridevorans]
MKVSGNSTNAEQVDASDVSNNKVMAILAYILFFVPLLVAKESKFAMYHANQGLILFLSLVAVNIVSSLIPIVGWLLIGPLGNLALFILAIMGIVNAAGGACKPIPILGGFRILKS